MSYLSLYRKWRPQVFADVVGQEHITRTISNALKTGRVAHAYLFSGPRGTGKTTMAKLLAKAVNCKEGPAQGPCNKCASCRSITAGNSMDVMEIDGASNRGIDQMRELCDKIGFAPVEGNFKVYIIDEVHMLTKEAFNALLKTLEEPPGHVLFIFATTELHKVPATILSRCQCFQFHRIAAEQIVQRLRTIAEAEGIKISDSALYLLARFAQGGLRDAISLLDQCVSFAQGEIGAQTVEDLLGLAGTEVYLRFTSALTQGDLKAALGELAQLREEGRDLSQFVGELLESWRELLLLKLTGQKQSAWSQEELARLESSAENVGAATLARWLEIFNRALEEMRWANRPQLTVELAVIKAVKSEEQESGALSARIEALEEKLRNSAFPQRQPREEHSGGIEQPSVPAEKPAAHLQTKKAAPEKQTSRSASQSAGLEQLREAWPAIGHWLRENRHIQIQAFVRDAQPWAINDQTLVLAFGPNQSFHKANVEREGNRELLSKAILAVTGMKLEIECIVTEAKAPVAVSDSVKRADSGEMEPLVKEALKLFGGHVIKKEEVDES
jgi:DNA polymerase-3 subunit gamma/tau